MFGVIQYGVYFWGASTAAASAREAARQIAVGTDWTCSHDQAVTRAGDAASGDPAITDADLRQRTRTRRGR